MAQKKKVTRIMKVTLDEDEFEKFDRGETHSDNGLRNENGQLSALPDIAPVSEDELPQKEVVRTEVICESEKDDSLGLKMAQAGLNIVGDILSDPEIQENIALLAKTLWHYKVKPKILDQVHKIKSSFHAETKASKMIENNEAEGSLVYQIEVNDEHGQRIVVTGEQAERMVLEFRKRARELSAMIFILSNISVKDEKTQEERVLEQSYLKQLASEESMDTMRTLTQYKQLLDEDTAVCLSDFLNGYVRNGNQLIKIPIQEYGQEN